MTPQRSKSKKKQDKTKIYRLPKTTCQKPFSIEQKGYQERNLKVYIKKRRISDKQINKLSLNLKGLAKQNKINTGLLEGKKLYRPRNRG